MFRFPYVLLILIILVTSCSHSPKKVTSTNNFGMLDDSIVTYNQEIVKNEDQSIFDFVSRYHWNMQKSSTGLRYLIYHKGKGPRAETGKVAVFNYSITLLNGDSCYSSKNERPREMSLGRSITERGLEEGLLLMNVGDRAKFIVPSHLAFGLLGDQKMIPPQATLVYDVELINLK